MRQLRGATKPFTARIRLEDRKANLDRKNLFPECTYHKLFPTMRHLELAFMFQKTTSRCTLTAVLDGTYTYGTFHRSAFANFQRKDSHLHFYLRLSAGQCMATKHLSMITYTIAVGVVR